MRTQTTTQDARELRLEGTTTSRFETALANLFAARRDYDALRGDARRIPELSAARFRLDEARSDVGRARAYLSI